MPEPHPRRTLVLGGARSGKSAFAESLLAPAPDVRYVATGYPAGDDPDWTARLAAHRDRRPPGWQTLETLDLVPLLGAATPPLLIDSLGLWLTRTMDGHDVWSARWPSAALDEAVTALVGAWAASPAAVVAVSDEVGFGVVPETAAGRRFRDVLGGLNQRLAAVSDAVFLVVAGQPLRVR